MPSKNWSHRIYGSLCFIIRCGKYTISYFVKKQVKKRYVIIIFIIAISGIVVSIFNSNSTLQYLFENKVWAHKVNNIKKLHEAEVEFKGVELDVVFMNNKKGDFFDVRHPPDSSINLSLTEYLQSIHGASECRYWLDFKNLNKDNELLSSAKLDSITTILKIDKTNVIVESKKPWHLKSFKEKGFRTSYYLPINLHILEPSVLKTEIEKTTKNISMYDNTYISADYKNYPILKKHFPENKKILWFTVYGSMNRFKARLLLYKILSDNNVDVLLIPYH